MKRDIDKDINSVMIERKVIKKKERIQREKYGLADSDWWNLYRHLEALLVNGLERMAIEGNSFPAKFAERENGREQWTSELRRISSLCRWLYQYDEVEGNLVDYCFPEWAANPVFAIDPNSLIINIKQEESETQRENFREFNKALAQRRRQILNEVLEWLKVYWFDLWD
jgi:hypothetical protein